MQRQAEIMSHARGASTSRVAARHMDRTAEIRRESRNPPLHNAAKADEAVSEAYTWLVDLKLGFDSWEEIPKSAQPLYKEIMGAMDACRRAGDKTYQVRMMVQRKKYGAEDVMPAVGDILYSSWGYDQTNVDFYQVIKVTPRQVVIEKIQKKVTGGGRGQDKVMPVPGRVDSRGKKLRRKWREYNGGVAVDINSYASAYSWDGKPQWQTASGYGH